MSSKLSLPIDRYMDDIVAGLSAKGSAILTAEPGAGKTTRLPLALMQRFPQQTIWVLQPRRIAAQLAAAYVAAAVNEEVGERVGYQVRFDSKKSQKTRLVFMTDGLLWRHFVADSSLSEVDTIVFDEFHERHVAADLGLSLAERLRRTSRPALRLLVMSATLDLDDVRALLPGAHAVHVPGRAYPVSIEYRPPSVAQVRSQRPPRQALVAHVKRAVVEALSSTPAAEDAGKPQGQVLVFLPGVREIDDSIAACREWLRGRGMQAVPLHGRLDLAAQRRAVSGEMPRVIFATNVAETSLTIDGVEVVIDSGLCRSTRRLPGSDLGSLTLGPVCKASAIQRAGRAGRTAAGRCVRLYSAADFAQRPAHDPPEISRSDLTSLCLTVAAMGVDVHGLQWVDTPPAAEVQRCVALLRRLGALHSESSVAGGTGETLALSITAEGRDILSWPVHPRLGRLLQAGREFSVAELVADAAALLSELSEETPRHAGLSGSSDIVAELEYLASTARAGDRGVGNFRQLQRRLRRRCRTQGGAGQPATATQAHWSAHERLARALLLAFPDRVGRLVAGGGQRAGVLEVRLADGGRMRVAEASVVRDLNTLVVVLTCAPEKRGALLATRLCAIEADWLLDFFPTQVRTQSILHWSEKHSRVQVTEGFYFGELALEESTAAAPASPEAGECLRQAVLDMGVERFDGRGHARALAQRLALLSRYKEKGGRAGGGQADAQVGEDETETAAAPAGRVGGEEFCLLALGDLCAGKTAVDWGPEGKELVWAIQARAGHDRCDMAERWFPEHLELANGVRVGVSYPAAAEPFIATYLQDFFGLSETPALAAGRLPLTLQLWAPNRRPIQITRDLPNFWRKHYPELSRALARRYPRHPWPADPASASPPPRSLRRSAPRRR